MRVFRASMSFLSARFVCAVSLADDFRPFGVVRSRVFRSLLLSKVLDGFDVALFDVIIIAFFPVSF